ncbi:MAG: TIGR00725 family protein [Actinomycetota bacterium]|nr:TIGR00725 family protein [Actinomycetota bacterium]
MRTIIGVMGGGEADPATTAAAGQLGALIAAQGWVLLTGGRACGVMDASSRGAHEAGGTVVGVLPDDDTRRTSGHVDIPILTGMGDARNVINVLSSRVVVAMRGSAGTISEVAHALKAGRPVVALDFPLGERFIEYYTSGRLVDVSNPIEAIEAVRTFLGERDTP